MYAKATTNIGLGRIKCKEDFLKKYKYAKIDKFEFDVELDSTANVSKYIVRYKTPENSDDGGASYDITSDTFKNNKEYRKDLFWKEFWEDTGTVQDFEKNEKILSGYSHASSGHHGWRVYVSNNKNFWNWFDALEITAQAENSPDKNLYKENKYLASLYAAYITTYSCGVSTFHFKGGNGVPNVVTSLMKYHLYFHTSRFLKKPKFNG